MPTSTQATRHIAIETPLGEDVLLLRRFSAHEEVSRLSQFELDSPPVLDGLAEAILERLYQSVCSGRVHQHAVCPVSGHNGALALVFDSHFELPHFPRENGAGYR